MTTVTKRELIDRVVGATELPRAEVRRTIQCFLERLSAELCHGHRLEFRDFGVFEVRERAARTAQNPKTMQRVHVPARKVVKFKAGRVLREGLENGKPPGRRERPAVVVRGRSRANAA